jgi:hypothetical protein
MGYWENTAYICSNDLDRIARTITDVFAREDARLMTVPPERSGEEGITMQYRPAAENPIWAVAIIPARDGWTAVKTAPLELLLERAPQATRARLSDLAAALGAECFQHNIYDGSEYTMFECTPDGAIAVTGAAEQSQFIECDEKFTPIRFHGEPWTRANPLTLVHADDTMMNDLDHGLTEDAFGQGMRVAGKGHSNRVQIEYLIRFRPLPIPKSRTLYFQNNRKT